MIGSLAMLQQILNTHCFTHVKVSLHDKYLGLEYMTHKECTSLILINIPKLPLIEDEPIYTHSCYI